MSTPENDPQTPSGDPNPPQYGQRAPQDPAAGQPPYGQQPQSGAAQPYNPYGQNPSPYGQVPPNNNPYGQPAPGNYPPGQQPYPGGFQMPQQGNFAPPQMPAHRPKELDTSFWAIIASGILFAVGTISSVFSMDVASFRRELSMVPDLESQLQTAGLSLDQMVGMLPTIQNTVIVFTVILLLVYVLVAFMVRKGSNVARIFATIFAVLSLLGLGSGLLLALSVILGVVGVVFAWLRPSSQYIAARRAARTAGYR
ncbi:MAG: hypothetical protein Q4P23_02465 [Micrococcaceae bacterium]|nr:hypothetical protein [Micrococcaceae bacterium]